MELRKLLALTGCAALVACGSSASDGGGAADETGGSSPAATGGGSPATGGGLGYGTGGASAGTGGASAGTGGASAGTGGTSAGAGGTPSTGACTPTNDGQATYTSIGVNNASWAGAGAGDKLDVNSSHYLPLVDSDCPLDPDMAVAEAYKDKIFNGCLDVCAGDTNNAGHAKATAISWDVSASGWAVAQISSNLHWTGMWAPSAGSEPVTVVFWIKGAAGCENSKFTVAIHSHLVDKLNPAVKLPINVSTAWQRVVIPWSKFNVPADPYPDALVFSSAGAGKVTIYVDQAYLSKTVKVP